MKQVYVSAARVVRSGLSNSGLLRSLDRWSKRSRTALWLRSLLAIYDLQDLAALDLPWWTFNSARRVGEFLRSRQPARAFEWGAGASTVWLAKRCVSVTTVEHDARWAQEIKSLMPINAELMLVPPVPIESQATPLRSHKAGFAGQDFSNYVSAIDRVDGFFDLIAVDGRAREACLTRALPRLAPGGLIVFDDVERQRYRKAIAGLGERADVEWTKGLTPCLPYPTQTAIIRLRSHACKQEACL
jgi:Methyltransferase domain